MNAVSTFVLSAALLSGMVAAADEIGGQGRVIVGAVFEAKVGKEPELDKFLSDHMATSWKDPGCIAFRIFKPLPRETRYFLFETWADRSALDVHLKRLTPDFWARFGELTVGKLQELKKLE